MRVPLALLMVGLGPLPGCNVVAIGVLALREQPGATVAASSRSFALAPHTGDSAAAIETATGGDDVGVGIMAGAAQPVDHIVRITGVALVNPNATGMANVSEGRVTGSTVRVIEANGARRLASAVTFYDGSFAVDVRFRAARQSVVLAVDLVDAVDRTSRATLAAPVVLQAGEVERRLAITPGSTALASYLGAVAAAPDAGQRAVATDPADFSTVVGPVFGGLIAGVDDDERESFVKMAESSPELAGAASLPAIRDGIRKFVGRLTVPELDR